MKSRRITPQEDEAIDYLRDWARAGFPRRADGSFPTDFLIAMRRIMDLPQGVPSSRMLEHALCAGPDFDHVMARHRHWSSHDTRAMRDLLA